VIHPLARLSAVRTQAPDRSVRQLALAIVRDIALDQHGIVLRQQALEAGLSSAAINRLVASGAWVRLAPRAYLVVDLASEHSRFAAAALAYPGTLASHRAAALLRGLDGADGAPPEVLAAWSRKVRIDGHVHRARDLDPGDWSTVEGIPCTTVTRTLCDVGSVVDDRVLEVMVESALRQRLTSVEDLRARAEALRRHGRSGPARLLAVLDQRPPGAPPTESWLETVFLQALRDEGVDPGVPQHVVYDADGRVVARLDRSWPDVKLYSELNGRAYHGHLESARDRWRQNRLAALGWLPLQFDHDDVVRRPRTTARTVQQALDRRRRAGR
jgi:hypothetical protein